MSRTGYGTRFQAAEDLFLVGWIKCRPNWAVGHVQGDVCALTAFQKWLRREEWPRDAALQVSHLQFSDDNYGLKSLDYRVLYAVKDWRKFNKQRVHARKQEELQVLQRLENRTAKPRNPHSDTVEGGKCSVQRCHLDV